MFPRSRWGSGRRRRLLAAPPKYVESTTPNAVHYGQHAHDPRAGLLDGVNRLERA
jgi:hypothetical protein